VDDLHKKACALLDKEVSIDPEALRLVHSQAPLDRDQTLEAAGITDDCDVFVHFKAQKKASDFD
jgi:hypothetical protein